METKKLTFSALLVAMGTIAGNLVYIPVGAAKCFPVQHAINLISAVLLGPWYGMANAFLISLLRNILGSGSPMAFPGSMAGAFLSGLLYMRFGKKLWAVAGEVFGTGILGALLAFPVAKLLMGKDVAAFYYIVPFMLSTIGGSTIGYLVLRLMEKNHITGKSETREVNRI